MDEFLNGFMGMVWIFGIPIMIVLIWIQLRRMTEVGERLATSLERLARASTATLGGEPPEESRASRAAGERLASDPDLEARVRELVRHSSRGEAAAELMSQLGLTAEEATNLVDRVLGPG